MAIPAMAPPDKLLLLEEMGVAVDVDVDAAVPDAFIAVADPDVEVGVLAKM